MSMTRQNPDPASFKAAELCENVSEAQGQRHAFYLASV